MLRKNIGKVITKEVNNAVFSDVETDPMNNPIAIKFIAAKTRIIIEPNVMSKDTPKSTAIINIAIISIKHKIRKYKFFAKINVGILVGLNNVLAKVPFFLSSTI